MLLKAPAPWQAGVFFLVLPTRSRSLDLKTGRGEKLVFAVLFGVAGGDVNNALHGVVSRPHVV